MMSPDKDAPYILIVDDDPDCRDLVMLAMQEIEGFSIRTAVDGLDAMRIMTTHGEPKLIVTDMTMPLMNGSQLIKEVRRNPDLMKTKIIILSGDSFLKREDSELSDVQLKKPSTREEVIAAAMKCLKRPNYDHS